VSENAVRNVAHASTLATAALGGLALVACVTGRPWLSAVLPGRPSMGPNMAFGTALAAVGVHLQVVPPVARGRRMVAVACGLLVLALGVATGAEWVLRADTGIDRLLVPAGTAEADAVRSSPLTALALVLAAAGILVFDRVGRRGARPAEWFALATAFVGVTAITGHAYGEGRFYELARGAVVGMSIPGAVAVLLLAAATLLARPGAGFMRRAVGATPGGVLVRRFGLAAVVAPSVLGLLVQLVERAGLRDRSLTFALLATSTIPIGLALVFWTARVVDRTHRALDESHEEERKLRVRLETLGRATVAVAEEVAALPRAPANALLQAILLQARALTHARYGAIGMGNDPAKPFDPWVFSGVSDGAAAAIGRSPRPVGLLGRVAHDGATVRVADVMREDSFDGFPAGHPPMASFLGVPIQFQGMIVGSLYLADKETAAEFSGEDEHLVEILAARAGAALETARAYRSEASGRTWLQSVIDQMPEAVIVTDPRGRIVHMNRAAQVFAHPGAGVGTEVLGGRWALDVRWPSGAAVESNELPLTRAIGRRETVTGLELLLRHPDGRLVPVVANASPIQGHEGEEGVVCVFQDVTLLKEIERLREEWTAVVAHDLRQPIGVISLSAANLTRPGLLTGDAAKAVERIEWATRTLRRMISDLLDASRIESRRLRVDRRRLALGPWLREIVERAAMTVDGFRVRVRVPDDLPDVFADRGRVEQIVTNLLSNAGRYGTPGTDVEVVAVPAGAEVAVSVTNRGPGLTADEIGHLFRRFHRAAGGRGDREGLGLGLFIVRGLVEAHRGRIDVTSTPGETTTFRFTLPAWRERGPLLAPEAASGTPAGRPAGGGRRW